MSLLLIAGFVFIPALVINPDSQSMCSSVLIFQECKIFVEIGGFPCGNKTVQECYCSGSVTGGRKEEPCTLSPDLPAQCLQWQKRSSVLPQPSHEAIFNNSLSY